MKDIQYTVQKIHPKTEKYYGAVHGANTDLKTICLLDMDENWAILTNNIGEGTITCKECIRKSE